mmetsp:Transcript_106396/g.343244  ORF Transcript_106396/g.343244 Transcript_106396/m.343244 type:complete len:227 (-) Transcript_106396:210-890(-)
MSWTSATRGASCCGRRLLGDAVLRAAGDAAGSATPKAAPAPGHRSASLPCSGPIHLLVPLPVGRAGCTSRPPRASPAAGWPASRRITCSKRRSSAGSCTPSPCSAASAATEPVPSARAAPLSLATGTVATRRLPLAAGRLMMSGELLLLCSWSPSASAALHVRFRQRSNTLSSDRRVSCGSTFVLAQEPQTSSSKAAVACSLPALRCLCNAETKASVREIASSGAT